MKNLKKIGFGLSVVLLAIGFSAFTNANKATGDIYVTLDGTNYTYIPTSEFDAGSCLNESSVPCSFTVTTEGAATIDREEGFTASELPSLTAAPAKISRNNSLQGLYNP